MWVKAKPVPFLLRLNKQKTKILSQSRMAGVKVYYLFSDTTEFYRRVTARISYADDYYPFVLVSREGFVIMWMNYFSFERIKSCERSCFICKNQEWMLNGGVKKWEMIRSMHFCFCRVYRGISERFCLRGAPYTPVLRHTSLLGSDRSSDHVFWHPNTHCLWNFYFVWHWPPKNSKISIWMIDHNVNLKIHISFTFQFTVLILCQCKFDISIPTSVWKLICFVRSKFSAYSWKYVRTYLLCMKMGNSLGMGKSL